MTIPYYPHQLDVLLAADPRLRASIDEMIGDEEATYDAGYQAGFDEGREDDLCPAAKRAREEEKNDVLARVRAVLDAALDRLDMDDDAISTVATMIEKSLGRVARETKGDDPDKVDLDAARAAMRGRIVRYSDSRFEVHCETRDGTAVLVKGEGFFLKARARATRFRTKEAARSAAARESKWDLPVVDAADEAAMAA